MSATAFRGAAPSKACSPRGGSERSERGDPSKRGYAGLCTAEDQRMDVVRPLVGVDGLEVQHVADHVELVDDAVAAVHVARHPCDLERLAAAVALHDRRDLGRCAALVLEPA